MKDPQLTCFYLHNNNQVKRYLQITRNLGYIACKTIILIYRAQLFIYLISNTKISIPKKLKNKTLHTSVPKHPRIIFYNKNNLLVIENLEKFNKKVIEFPLKKTTIF